MDYKKHAIEVLKKPYSKESRRLSLDYRSGFYVDFGGPEWEPGNFWFINAEGFGDFGYLEVKVENNGGIETPVLLLSNIHGTIKGNGAVRDDLRYRGFTEKHKRNPYNLAIEYLLGRAKPLVRDGWIIGLGIDNKTVRDRYFTREKKTLLDCPDLGGYCLLNPEKKRVKRTFSKTLLDKIRSWDTTPSTQSSP